MDKAAIHKQFTNVGAWFSSDMDSSSYALIDLGNSQIITVFCFRSENYNKAVDRLVKIFRPKGQITDIRYAHDSDCFFFDLIHRDGTSRYKLEAIDKYLEEI